MRVLTLLFITLFLYACSFGSTLYNNFDYVVLWQVSDYVSLTKEQKRLFRRASKDFIDWHRQHELPKYQQLIFQLEKDLRNNTLTHIKAQQYQQNIRLLRNNLVHYLEDHTPSLFTGFTEKQYNQLLKNITKQVSENNARTQQERRENSVERWQRWYGELNPEQELTINRLQQKRQDQWPIWEERTKNWLTQLERATSSTIQLETTTGRSVNLQNEKANKVNQALWSIFDNRNYQYYSEIDEIMQLWLQSDESQKQHVLEELEEIKLLIEDCLAT
ncbi:hypothetical protein CBF23_010055 [Marinomonas agarivorans]|nr:hypothetical protein CBF23_010055 [Marinomonas agarivorans]